MSHYHKLFWLLTSITTLIRVSIIGFIGLTVDEAHYWVYSKFLDLSYYDHPPVIGYIIKIFTDIFGINEFAVRLPSVIIFILTSWIIFLATRKIFEEKVAFITIVLLNILPVFSFLGAVVTIPDAPLSLFWALTFYLFILIIQTKKQYYWYIIGFTVGFGLLSKYTAILLFPSILLFLVCSKEHRFLLKQKEIYISMIIAFICFIPVILWNLQNNWASFGFQLQHGFGKTLPSLSLTLFGRSIGAQAGYISPLLFLFYCYAIYKLIKEYFISKNTNLLFIISFSLPTLFFFNSIATFNEILPHWPAMGYLILTIYVSAITIQFWNNSKFRKFMYISCAFALLMNILVPIQAIFKPLSVEPFLKLVSQNTIDKHGIPQSEVIDVTNDLRGWDELSKAIKEIYDSYPNDNKPFVFTHKSYLASQIYFCIPDIRVYCLSNKIDAYDLWQRNLENLNRKDGLFITSNMFTFNDYSKVYPFEQFDEQIEVPVYKNGKIIKKFWIVICKNFCEKDLPEKYTSNLVGNKKTIKQGFIDFDGHIFKFFNNQIKNKPMDFIISCFSYCDTKGVNLSLILMIILTLFILRKEKKSELLKYIILITVIMLIASGVNNMFKHIFDRPRPLPHFGEGNINLFYEILYRHSFPSGHSQAAFTLATIASLLVPKYWYLFFTLAILTAIERMYAGCHFPSDVFAGAIIGMLIAYLLFKMYNIMVVKFIKNKK